MHRLVASARGALIGDRPWAGRILSVHPRALNILRADGLAVSVVADRASMSAMGVLAKDLFESPPDRQLADRAAGMEEGVLSLDRWAAVACARCPAWEGRVDAAAVRLISVEVVQAIREALFDEGKPGGLLEVLGNGAARSAFATRVRDSLENGRPEELVGCGPGLTPAGDDFLAGAILASPASFVHGDARFERRLPGTTSPGRTLLWMALQGRFPAYLVDFIDTAVTASASRDAIRSAVRAACAHGETSGTDALAGFCWQRESITNRQPDPEVSSGTP
jgi:hypothetical protein